MLANSELTKGKTYIGAVGRRKTAVASVRLIEESNGRFMVNEQEMQEYFPEETLQQVASQALELTENASAYSVSVLVRGGGPKAQAEATRHGIARALVQADPELRSELKKAGFLKRDPRGKERKKFGLKKARRRPQWSKR